MWAPDLSIYLPIYLSNYLSIHSFVHPPIYLPSMDLSISIRLRGAYIYIYTEYVCKCVCANCNARVHKVTIASKLGSHPKVSECKGKLLSNGFNRRTSPWHPEYGCYWYIEAVCPTSKHPPPKKKNIFRKESWRLHLYLKIYIDPGSGIRNSQKK